MDEALLQDVLAKQADDLARGEGAKPREAYLQILPSRAAELAPLLEIAERTSRLMSVQVKPDAAFREELHRELLAMAQQRYPGGWANSPPWMNVSRSWIIGAAAVGSAVSVAGLVAYFIRQRQLPALFR
ncbi:MAG: hypothetical protein GXP41_04540 [Chloroflexi bacterium]|nr:hypothetical protein [Chloroflexota bacterium]